MIDLSTPLFHGTSSMYEAAIRHEVRAGAGENYDGEGQLGPGFYMTPQLEAATFFAHGACRTIGGIPLILRVIIPNRSWVGIAVPEVLWWRIPTEFLTAYDYLEAPITGLPMWYNVKFNPHCCGLLRVE